MSQHFQIHALLGANLILRTLRQSFKTIEVELSLEAWKLALPKIEREKGLRKGGNVVNDKRFAMRLPAHNRFLR